MNRPRPRAAALLLLLALLTASVWRFVPRQPPAGDAEPDLGGMAMTGSIASPTPYIEGAAWLALLPPGATANWDDRVHGSSVGDDRIPVVALPYSDQGRPSMALFRAVDPVLLWDLRDHPELTAGVTEVSPRRHGSSAGELILLKGAVTRALVLDVFEGKPIAFDDLTLPDAVAEAMAQGFPYTLLRRDLTGDGLIDPILDAGGNLALFERQADGGARLLPDGGRGALLVDPDHDDVVELIAPAQGGGWARSVWRDGAFQVVETLEDPDPPTAVAVTGGDLPPLPGNLTFVRHGAGDVLRWPRDGGELRTLRHDALGEADLLGLRVSTASGDALVAVASSDRAGDTELVLLTEGAPPRPLAAPGEVRDFAFTPDGLQVVYSGLISDAAQSASDHGAVYAVTIADADEARQIARCETVLPSAPGIVGCHGELALSADGRRVAYGDGKALWVANLDGGPPQEVAPSEVVDAERRIQSRFWPRRWSPDGQRLLIDWEMMGTFMPQVITPGGARLRAVTAADFSLPMGQGEPIFGALRDVPDQGGLVWRPDGGSLVASQWGDRGLGEVWAVDPGPEERDTPLISIGAIMDRRQYQSYGLAIAADGGLRFGLRQSGTSSWMANAVVRAEPDGSGMRRLADLDSQTDEVSPKSWPLKERGILIWSPDGDAFVVRFSEKERSRTLVGLADGSALWDASSVLSDADWITWSR